MTDYRDHAYKRTIVQQLQRLMLDNYIASDSPPKETLICEELPRHESEVPQEALMSVFNDLQLWENDQRTKMSAYKWRKDDEPLPFMRGDPAKPPSAEAKKNGIPKSKPKRSKKATGNEGSGGDA
jgi:hypothetical protein